MSKKALRNKVNFLKDTKYHVKAYKSKKFWMFAGLFAMMLGGSAMTANANHNVHADTTNGSNHVSNTKTQSEPQKSTLVSDHANNSAAGNLNNRQSAVSNVSAQSGNNQSSNAKATSVNVNVKANVGASNPLNNVAKRVGADDGSTPAQNVQNAVSGSSWDDNSHLTTTTDHNGNVTLNVTGGTLGKSSVTGSDNSIVHSYPQLATVSTINFSNNPTIDNLSHLFDGMDNLTKITGNATIAPDAKTNDAFAGAPSLNYLPKGYNLSDDGNTLYIGYDSSNPATIGNNNGDSANNSLLNNINGGQNTVLGAGAADALKNVKTVDFGPHVSVGSGDSLDHFFDGMNNLANVLNSQNIRGINNGSNANTSQDSVTGTGNSQFNYEPNMTFSSDGKTLQINGVVGQNDDTDDASNSLASQYALDPRFKNVKTVQFMNGAEGTGNLSHLFDGMSNLSSIEGSLKVPTNVNTDGIFNGTGMSSAAINNVQNFNRYELFNKYNSNGTPNVDQEADVTNGLDSINDLSKLVPSNDSFGNETLQNLPTDDTGKDAFGNTIDTNSNTAQLFFEPTTSTTDNRNIKAFSDANSISSPASSKNGNGQLYIAQNVSSYYVPYYQKGNINQFNFYNYNTGAKLTPNGADADGEYYWIGDNPSNSTFNNELPTDYQPESSNLVKSSSLDNYVYNAKTVNGNNQLAFKSGSTNTLDNTQPMYIGNLNQYSVPLVPDGSNDSNPQQTNPSQPKYAPYGTVDGTHHATDAVKYVFYDVNKKMNGGQATYSQTLAGNAIKNASDASNNGTPIYTYTLNYGNNKNAGNINQANVMSNLQGYTLYSNSSKGINNTVAGSNAPDGYYNDNADHNRYKGNVQTIYVNVAPKEAINHYDYMYNGANVDEPASNDGHAGLDTTQDLNNSMPEMPEGLQSGYYYDADDRNDNKISQTGNPSASQAYQIEVDNPDYNGTNQAKIPEAVMANVTKYNVPVKQTTVKALRTYYYMYTPTTGKDRTPRLVGSKTVQGGANNPHMSISDVKDAYNNLGQYVGGYYKEPRKFASNPSELNQFAEGLAPVSTTNQVEGSNEPAPYVWNSDPANNQSQNNVYRGYNYSYVIPVDYSGEGNYNGDKHGNVPVNGDRLVGELPIPIYKDYVNNQGQNQGSKQVGTFDLELGSLLKENQATQNATNGQPLHVNNIYHLPINNNNWKAQGKNNNNWFQNYIDTQFFGGQKYTENNPDLQGFEKDQDPQDLYVEFQNEAVADQGNASKNHLALYMGFSPMNMRHVADVDGSVANDNQTGDPLNNDRDYNVNRINWDSDVGSQGSNPLSLHYRYSNPEAAKVFYTNFSGDLVDANDTNFNSDSGNKLTVNTNNNGKNVSTEYQVGNGGSLNYRKPEGIVNHNGKDSTITLNGISGKNDTYHFDDTNTNSGNPVNLTNESPAYFYDAKAQKLYNVDPKTDEIKTDDNGQPSVAGTRSNNSITGNGISFNNASFDGNGNLTNLNANGYQVSNNRVTETQNVGTITLSDNKYNDSSDYEPTSISISNGDYKQADNGTDGNFDYVNGQIVDHSYDTPSTIYSSYQNGTLTYKNGGKLASQDRANVDTSNHNITVDNVTYDLGQYTNGQSNPNLGNTDVSKEIGTYETKNGQAAIVYNDGNELVNDPNYNSNSGTSQVKMINSGKQLQVTDPKGDQMTYTLSGDNKGDTASVVVGQYNDSNKTFKYNNNDSNNNETINTDKNSHPSTAFTFTGNHTTGINGHVVRWTNTENGHVAGDAVSGQDVNTALNNGDGTSQSEFENYAQSVDNQDDKDNDVGVPLPSQLNTEGFSKDADGNSTSVDYDNEHWNGYTKDNINHKNFGVNNQHDAILFVNNDQDNSVQNDDSNQDFVRRDTEQPKVNGVFDDIPTNGTLVKPSSVTNHPNAAPTIEVNGSTTLTNDGFNPNDANNILDYKTPDGKAHYEYNTKTNQLYQLTDNNGKDVNDPTYFVTPKAADGSNLKNNPIDNGDTAIVVPFADQVPSNVSRHYHYITPVNVRPGYVPDNKDEYEKGTFDANGNFVPNDKDKGDLKWDRAPETLHFIEYDTKSGKTSSTPYSVTYYPETAKDQAVGTNVMMPNNPEWDKIIPQQIQNAGYTQLDSGDTNAPETKIGGSQFFTITDGGATTDVYVDNSGSGSNSTNPNDAHNYVPVGPKNNGYNPNLPIGPHNLPFIPNSRPVPAGFPDTKNNPDINNNHNLIPSPNHQHYDPNNPADHDGLVPDGPNGWLPANSVPAIQADFVVSYNLKGNDGGSDESSTQLPVAVDVDLNHSQLNTTYTLSTKNIREAIVNDVLAHNYTDHNGQQGDLMYDSIERAENAAYTPIKYQIKENSKGDYHVVLAPSSAGGNGNTDAGQFQYTPSTAIINYEGMTYGRDADSNNMKNSMNNNDNGSGENTYGTDKFGRKGTDYRNGTKVESVLAEGYQGMKVDPSSNHDVTAFFNNTIGWSITGLQEEHLPSIILAGNDTDYHLRNVDNESGLVLRNTPNGENDGNPVKYGQFWSNSELNNEQNHLNDEDALFNRKIDSPSNGSITLEEANYNPSNGMVNDSSNASKTLPYNDGSHAVLNNVKGLPKNEVADKVGTSKTVNGKEQVNFDDNTTVTDGSVDPVEKVLGNSGTDSVVVGNGSKITTYSPNEDNNGSTKNSDFTLPSGEIAVTTYELNNNDNTKDHPVTRTYNIGSDGIYSVIGKYSSNNGIGTITTQNGQTITNGSLLDSDGEPLNADSKGNLYVDPIDYDSDNIAQNSVRVDKDNNNALAVNGVDYLMGQSINPQTGSTGFRNDNLYQDAGKYNFEDSTNTNTVNLHGVSLTNGVGDTVISVKGNQGQTQGKSDKSAKAGDIISVTTPDSTLEPGENSDKDNYTTFNFVLGNDGDLYQDFGTYTAGGANSAHDANGSYTPYTVTFNNGVTVADGAAVEASVQNNVPANQDNNKSTKGNSNTPTEPGGNDDTKPAGGNNVADNSDNSQGGYATQHPYLNAVRHQAVRLGSVRQSDIDRAMNHLNRPSMKLSATAMSVPAVNNRDLNRLLARAPRVGTGVIDVPVVRTDTQNNNNGDDNSNNGNNQNPKKPGTPNKPGTNDNKGNGTKPGHPGSSSNQQQSASDNTYNNGSAVQPNGSNGTNGSASQPVNPNHPTNSNSGSNPSVNSGSASAPASNNNGSNAQPSNPSSANSANSDNNHAKQPSNPGSSSNQTNPGNNQPVDNQSSINLNYYDQENGETVPSGIVTLDGTRGNTVPNDALTTNVPADYQVASNFKPGSYSYNDGTVSIPVVKINRGSNGNNNNQQPTNPNSNNSSATAPSDHRASLLSTASSMIANAINSANNDLNNDISRNNNKGEIENLQNEIKSLAASASTKPNNNNNGNQSNHESNQDNNSNFTDVTNSYGWRYAKILDNGQPLTLHSSVNLGGNGDQTLNEFAPGQHTTFKILKTYKQVLNGKTNVRFLVQVFDKTGLASTPGYYGYVDGNPDEVEKAYYNYGDGSLKQSNQGYNIQARNFNGVEIHSTPTDWGNHSGYEHFIKRGQVLHVDSLVPVSDLYRFQLNYGGHTAYVTANKNFVKVL